jgi:putative flippase GtrA
MMNMFPGLMTASPEVYISLLRRVFIHSSDQLIIQFLRNSLASFVAFTADFGILAILTCFVFFRNFYIAAASISFITGVVISYYLSIKWVFSRRNLENRNIEFILFTAVGVIGLGLNVLLIFIFTEGFFLNIVFIPDKQLRILVSKIIAALFVYLWNFSARKITLFR